MHLKLLLVEDNEVYRKFVETILEEDVDKIHHVNKLAEAREEFKLHNFDVIVCDLGLPDSSRPATVEAIPSIMEAQPDAALIIASGFPEYRDAAMEAGAELFLDKATTAKHGAMVIAIRVAMQEAQTNPKRNALRLERMAML